MLSRDLKKTYAEGLVDAQDMAAVCADNQQAFHRVVARHQGHLLAYCLRLLGDLAAAQDVAQEVFLTLWKERRKYREDQKLRFFLLKIARLRCLATLKKRRARSRLVQSKQQAQQSSSETTQATPQESRALREALSRLKTEFAELLILRHLEGLDLAEIQTVTGLRQGTIKSRIHRGMEALRKELGDDFE